MEKNKSIDGLVPRGQKKSSKAKKPTPKKTTTKPAPKKAPTKINIKEVKKTSSEVAEEFLKPVQAFNFDESDGELKATEKKAKKEKKPKKEKKKKAGKVRKVISIIALIIVLGIIGLVVWAILWGNDIIAKITGGQGNVFDLIFTSETYVPLKTDENGRTNILAFGTSGYNMEGEEGDGVHDGAQLTDSIMLLSFDQETSDVAMVSLPRDLKASPTCTATGKINEVYWCNNMDDSNEQAGAEALMAEVGTILGVDIQYFAHINWGSLVQIVDALGGINVTLDETVYGYYGNYEAGVEYHLDGEEALILSRERYGTSKGDFSRSENQQKILIGIKDRVLEKKFSIPDYLSLASALGDNLRTNFSIDELKSLAHLASTLNFDSMRQISLLEPVQFLSTGMINSISYVIPSAGVGNYGNIQAYIQKMTSSDPRVYEEPSILILNSTNEDGLAGKEKAELEQKGYESIDVDNIEGDFEDKYTIYETSSKPGTKLLLESYYNVTVKPLSDSPVSLPEGYDFIIVLNYTNEE